MITKELYFSKLKKYSFKALVDRVSKEDPSNKVLEGRNTLRIGGVTVASTDDNPCNPVTLTGILTDLSELPFNKKTRKTVSHDELLELCKTRNVVLPIEKGTFAKGKGLGSVFASSFVQSLFLFKESLPQNYLRSYYIFTEIDKLMASDKGKYLSSKSFFDKLCNCDCLITFVMLLLLYEETIQSGKRFFKKPFTIYEQFFVNHFDNNEIVFSPNNREKYNPLRHCLIHIGNTYYIPSLGSFYHRLSDLFYWVYKDFCKKNIKISNFFPSRFGYYFEEYINQYLKYNLGDNNYKRLDEIIDSDSNKKPDFEFQRCNYKFVVECKSRLIAFKDVDNKLCTGHFREDIEDGLSQLQSFKKEEDFIRIIVLYENTFPILELFENELRRRMSLNEKYWIITVNEFESLMDVAEGEDFEKVINYRLTKLKSDTPVSLGQCLKDCNVGYEYSRFYLEHIEKTVNEAAKDIVDAFNSI